MQTNGNVNGSILDLSEMRQAKVEKAKEPEITIEMMEQVIKIYENTLLEGANLRSEQMQEMIKAQESVVQPLPGQPHPSQEVAQRLKFLDASMRRLRDMILGGRMMIKMSQEGFDMTPFPAFAKNLSVAKKMLIDNKDKMVHETTPAEGMMIASFRDLYETMKVLEG